MQPTYKLRQLVEALPLPPCTLNSRRFWQTATAPPFPLLLPFNGSPRQRITSPQRPFISAIFWHPTSTRDRLPPSPHSHHFLKAHYRSEISPLRPPYFLHPRATHDNPRQPHPFPRSRAPYDSPLKLPKVSLSTLLSALLWQLATAPSPLSSLLPFRSLQHLPTAPSPPPHSTTL